MKGCEYGGISVQNRNVVIKRKIFKTTIDHNKDYSKVITEVSMMSMTWVLQWGKEVGFDSSSKGPA